ncbi:hypothetical protein N9L26_02715 [Candidatus Pacebacteria bacterium]|nr:hypothetical protein [Candidatus Paceibacterota bacterium]
MTHTISRSFTRGFTAMTVLALLLSLLPLESALAQTAPETVTVHLEKKFSGPVPAGYTADMFSFTVTGTTASSGDSVNETVNLTAYTDATANATIDLPQGSYTVTENGPSDFAPGEWRPGWYGDACASGSDFSTTMTIDDGNIDHGTIYCQVDNQWRFGTLRVIKEFIGTSSAYTDFQFMVTQDSGTKYDGPFNTTGDVEVIVGAGDYEVVETVTGNYTPSYSAGCTGTMGEEDAQTCTITNTYDDDNGGGGGTTGDSTGNLVVNKVVTGGSSTSTDFTFTPSWGADFTLSANESTSTALATGTYSVSEASLSNWSQIGAECVYEDLSTSTPATILVTEDETVTCTFTNEETDNTGGGGGNGADDGTIIITKTVSASSSTSTTFNFSGSWGSDFTLGAGASTSYDVASGTYSVSELAITGWTQTNAECVYEDQSTSTPAVISVAENETVICTFVNTEDEDDDSTGGGGNNNPGSGGNNSSGGSSGGGGSVSPRCDAFDLTEDDGVYTLTWETRRGEELTIDENGSEIYATDNEDIVDEGNLVVNPAGSTTYDLTVIDGRRDDTCSVTLDGPTPQVLGDQVSAVPLGAANAGAGGASGAPLSSLPFFIGTLLALASIRVARNAR